MNYMWGALCLVKEGFIVIIGLRTLIALIIVVFCRLISNKGND